MDQEYQTTGEHVKRTYGLLIAFKQLLDKNMIEYHNLPDNENKQLCWLAVYEDYTEYHYSINGCYFIENFTE